MIKHKLTADPLFHKLTKSELLMAYEMISRQIEEMQALTWELNGEQNKIMLRVHALEKKEEETP